jgi:hypothetical protein
MEKEELAKNKALVAEIQETAAAKHGINVKPVIVPPPVVKVAKPTGQRESRRMVEEEDQSQYSTIPVIGAWTSVDVPVEGKAVNLLQQADSLNNLSADEQKMLILNIAMPNLDNPDDLRSFKVTEKRIQVDSDDEPVELTFKKRKATKKNIRVKD